MFSEWRGDIARAPEGVRTPGELARDALGALDDPAALERAATLVREAKIGPWPPLPELLQELVEKLTKLGEGTLVVSPAARREQSDQVLEEALPRIYAEPHADRTAARFEEAAYVFWKNDAEDDARACLAAAASFRAGEPAANPVARVLLEVVLEPALRKLEDGGDAGGADASGVET
jgi:hypothetical protein